MANYQNIVRLRPEVREFIRNRRWVYRGEVVVYGPNTRCAAFSTDSAGFRHSVFKGETLSVADCLKRDRFGIVLGSSHLYGFGLAGNENTIPSLLAERFGFPFAGACMPEASSRNLFSLLLAFTAGAPRPPSVVVLMSGGDFTSFCYTSVADPVFGSPNLKQIEMVLKERGGRPAAESQFPPLLAFTSLWTRSIVRICRAQKIPVVLTQDTTFFEKEDPSPIEVESQLGTPSAEAQAQQFATHRKYINDFCVQRASLAKALAVPLAGAGSSNALSFIDEFHYDREGTRAVADGIARAIEPLL
jgi:hypothetical protein